MHNTHTARPVIDAPKATRQVTVWPPAPAARPARETLLLRALDIDAGALDWAAYGLSERRTILNLARAPGAAIRAGRPTTPALTLPLAHPTLSLIVSDEELIDAARNVQEYRYECYTVTVQAVPEYSGNVDLDAYAGIDTAGVWAPHAAHGLTWPATARPAQSGY